MVYIILLAIFLEKLINANNKLFAFTNDNISYVSKREKLSANYELSSIPIPNSIRETKDGYENILYTGDDKYLIGTTSWLYHYRFNN